MPRANIVARHGALEVRNGRLCGEDGLPVMLRGMSLFWSQWSGHLYCASSIAKLARDWRAGVVRVPVGVEPAGFLENPDAELDKLEAVLEAAVDEGIYLIVDWHAHCPHTPAAVEFFSQLARRYGALANLLYEPWNEPLPRYDWTFDIRPHHEAVLSAIRGVGARGVAICSVPDHCQSFGPVIEEPLSDANVAYALHFYAASHRDGLRSKAYEASAAGLAVLASEYGIGDSTGNGPLDPTEMARWWAFMEELGIGHVNWSYSDKQESCSALRRRRFGCGHALTRSGRIVRGALRKMQKETYFIRKEP